VRATTKHAPRHLSLQTHSIIIIFNKQTHNARKHTGSLSSDGGAWLRMLSRWEGHFQILTKDYDAKHFLCVWIDLHGLNVHHKTINLGKKSMVNFDFMGTLNV